MIREREQKSKTNGEKVTNGLRMFGVAHRANQCLGTVQQQGNAVMRNLMSSNLMASNMPCCSLVVSYATRQGQSFGNATEEHGTPEMRVSSFKKGRSRGCKFCPRPIS